MTEIRGEYWIQDGQVDFADGDVGDKNHEYIAMEHVAYQFSDNIANLAEEFDIETDFEGMDGINMEAIQNVLNELEEKIGVKEVGRRLGASSEAYAILSGYGDPRLYCMTYEGWIAVRGNNAELFNYNEIARKNLAHGLWEICDQEGIEEPSEEIFVDIHDHKTGRSFEASLTQLEQPVVVQPALNPMRATTNKKFVPSFSDEQEKYNYPPNYGKKPEQSPWDKEAQKQKVIGPGQNLWRGTSEGFLNFKEWLVNLN